MRNIVHTLLATVLLTTAGIAQVRPAPLITPELKQTIGAEKTDPD